MPSKKKNNLCSAIKSQSLSYFDLLPHEILLNLVDNINITDVKNVSLTSRSLNNILQDNHFWKQKYISHFPHGYKKLKNNPIDWKELFIHSYKQYYGSHYYGKIFSFIKENDFEGFRLSFKKNHTKNVRTQKFFQILKMDLNGWNMVDWAREKNAQRFLDYFYKIAENLFYNNPGKDKVIGRDPEQNTLLHWAVKCKKPLKIIQRIAAKNYIDDSDNLGNTALHYAVKYRLLDVAEYLITHGADINFVNDNDKSPLWMAIKNSDIAMINLLLTYGAEYDHEDFKLAVKLGYKEIVETFMNLGTPLHQPGSSNALHIAIKHNQVALIPLLVKGGVDIYEKNAKGKSPFFLAMMNGSEKTDFRSLMALLEIKNVINESDSKGNTLLHLATKLPHPKEVIQFLLRYKADPTIRNHANQTPLLFALDNHLIRAAKCLVNPNNTASQESDADYPLINQVVALGDEETLATLLSNDKNAIYYYSMKERNTPLHVAINSQKRIHIPVLLEYGADIFAKNHDKETPFHLAAKLNDNNTLEILLTHFFQEEKPSPLMDHDLLNSSQETPLHIAARNGNLKGIQLLCQLKNEYNIHLHNAKGDTPLHLALQNGFLDIAYQLIKCGADLNAKNLAHKTAYELAPKNLKYPLKLELYLQNGGYKNDWKYKVLSLFKNNENLEAVRHSAALKLEKVVFENEDKNNLQEYEEILNSGKLHSIYPHLK